MVTVDIKHIRMYRIHLLKALKGFSKFKHPVVHPSVLKDMKYFKELGFALK
jgi:hypothetical protein